MDANIIWKILLVLQPFAGTFIVNALGGNLSEKNRKWYNGLKQSPLTPPPIVFPIACKPAIFIFLSRLTYFLRSAHSN